MWQVGGDHCLRARQPSSAATAERADAPTAAPAGSTQYNAMMKAAASHLVRREGKWGLGGGTLGSEGYGEATIGSVHKVGTALRHLRQLVLSDLHDGAWGILWDLGPWSSVLDIGSGYGKVVMHMKLLARARRSVGMECVLSRHNIAKASLAAVIDETAEGAEARAPKRKRAKGAATEKENHADGAADASGEESGRVSPAASAGDKSAAPAEETPSAAGGAAKRAADPPPASNGVAAVPRVPASDFGGVEFLQCDVTLEEKLAYTHIYMYDWVFSKNTLSQIATVLQARSCRDAAERPPRPAARRAPRSRGISASLGVSRAALAVLRVHLVPPRGRVVELWARQDTARRQDPGLPQLGARCGRDAAEIAPRALRIDATALRAQGGESMTGFVYINLEKVPAGGSDAL